MTKRSPFLAVLMLLTVGASPNVMRSQGLAPEKESSSLASYDLPDSPGAVMEREFLLQATGAQESKPGSTAPASPKESKYRRIIRAEHTAEPLSAKDKFALSLLSRASLTATAGTLFSTSISYWRNGTPHYGTNLPAFGERFGAAELRQVSSSFFSNGLYAAAFHDDPRYYVMGPKEKVSKRAIYAATRVLITRKDDGSPAPNWPALLGIASTVALTNAYYPPADRGVGRTVSSTFASIGATAGATVFREFSGDIRHRVFHKR